MRIVILGIDGMDTGILDKYMDHLPNFKMIREKGVLSKLNTVFPADSVPAWQTIYTGLNPAQHGIIRGKDFVESVEEFEKQGVFKLEGKTFWDKASSLGKKCLVLNPFLAYPSWKVNGIMVSGPAFVEGGVSKHPFNTVVDNSVYGGYKAMKNVRQLRVDMDKAFDDTVRLWNDFITLFEKEHFDLSFTLFTTLDRIQHYTWRFFDPLDPLHEKDPYLSNFILKTLQFFDKKLGDLISQLQPDDKLVLISDHGFGQRPFKLINFNEILRREGMLRLKKGADKKEARFKQKMRNNVVRLLSKFRVLDIAASLLKRIPYFAKYKKSSHLIDTENSLLYSDELFCGKKPYCGFRFGDNVKLSSNMAWRQEILTQLLEIFRKYPELHPPRWVRFNNEVYEGPYCDRLPDICMELQKEFGVEFDFFGTLITESATHFKLSGGHYDAGTFGYFSPSGEKLSVSSVEQFHEFITLLFGEVENTALQQVLLS